MSRMNNTIVIRNIRDLMNANSVTQNQLAEALGMSQSNVSKALNENEKKSFTFEQIVNIADYFKVSIDSLVESGTSIIGPVSRRSIGRLLSFLITNGYVDYIALSKEEDVFEWDDDDCYCTPHTKKIVYPYIYFPQYYQLPDSATNNEREEWYDEMRICGNDTGFEQINTFLAQLFRICKIYKSGSLSKDTYQTVVNDLLSHLSDEQLQTIPEKENHIDFKPDFLEALENQNSSK